MESPSSLDAIKDQPVAKAEQPKPESRKGTSPLFNFWVDMALGLAVTMLAWVSIMMQIVFPAPTAAAGWELWDLSYDQWRNVQFGALCVAIVLALEHVVLHWKWVCGVIATKLLRLKNKPDEGTQAMYGIATFVGTLLLLQAVIVIAMFMVRRPPG